MSKKLFFAIISVCMLAINISYAQFEMSAGDADLGLRVGAVPNARKFNTREKFHATSPVVGFTWETGVWNFGLSLGGEFNYATYKNQEKTGTMTVLMGMIYAKYYPKFLIVSKFAPYARLDLIPIGVYKISTPKQIDSGANSIMGIYAGANYQFADRFGVFGEIGVGYTILNVGLTLRAHEN